MQNKIHNWHGFDTKVKKDPIQIQSVEEISLSYYGDWNVMATVTDAIRILLSIHQKRQGTE